MAYLKNYQMDGDKPIKLIVWSKSREDWAGVGKATRKHYNDIQSGTYQIVELGDIIVSCKLNESDVPTMELHEVAKVTDDSEGLLSSVELTDVSVGGSAIPVFQNLDADMSAWIKRLSNSADGFLPAGCGWDGTYSLYDQRKRLKIKNLLFGVTDNDFLTRIINAGQLSAGQLVPVLWDEAVQLPYDRDCTVDVEVVPSTKGVYMVQWFKDHVTHISEFHEDFAELEYLPIDPNCIKVMVGEFNRSAVSDKTMTRWRLYHR